jgi:hypothetical protein
LLCSDKGQWPVAVRREGRPCLWLMNWIVRLHMKTLYPVHNSISRHQHSTTLGYNLHFGNMSGHSVTLCSVSLHSEDKYHSESWKWGCYSAF